MSASPVFTDASKILQGLNENYCKSAKEKSVALQNLNGFLGTKVGQVNGLTVDGSSEYLKNVRRSWQQGVH